MGLRDDERGCGVSEQVRGAAVVEVIRIVLLRGEGVSPSPFPSDRGAEAVPRARSVRSGKREVAAYYLPDGTFIGEHDPHDPTEVRRER